MEVSFSSSFKRAFKRQIKANADLEARFWQKLEQFTIEPFEPSLKTHTAVPAVMRYSSSS